MTKKIRQGREKDRSGFSLDFLDLDYNKITKFYNNHWDTCIGLWLWVALWDPLSFVFIFVSASPPFYLHSIWKLRIWYLQTPISNRIFSLQCDLGLQRNVAANFAVQLRSKYRTNVKNFVTFFLCKICFGTHYHDQMLTRPNGLDRSTSWYLILIQRS